MRWALLGLATPAMILLGAPWSRGLKRVRRLSLDTDVLIALGVLAAFTLSAWSVLAGEGPLYLDTAMRDPPLRHRRALPRGRDPGPHRPMPSPPSRARCPPKRWRVSGESEERVAVATLVPGNEVRVRPGERIPVDGDIVSGEAGVSEAEITGESEPAHRGPGYAVAAGTLNLDGSLLVRVERTGDETTVARLVRLVSEARGGTLSPRPPGGPGGVAVRAGGGRPGPGGARTGRRRSTSARASSTRSRCWSSRAPAPSASRLRSPPPPPRAAPPRRRARPVR